MSARAVIQDHAVRVKMGPRGMTGIVHFVGEVCRMPIGNGRFYYFDNHRYFGPTRLHAKTGEPTKDNFSERSGFWPLYDRWSKAGKRVTDDGVCIL